MRPFSAFSCQAGGPADVADGETTHDPAKSAYAKSKGAAFFASYAKSAGSRLKRQILSIDKWLPLCYHACVKIAQFQPTPARRQAAQLDNPSQTVSPVNHRKQTTAPPPARQACRPSGHAQTVNPSQTDFRVSYSKHSPEAKSTRQLFRQARRSFGLQVSPGTGHSPLATAFLIASSIIRIWD